MAIDVNPEYFKARDEAEKLVDDLAAYVDALDWRTPFTKQQLKDISQKLNKIETYVDKTLYNLGQGGSEGEYIQISDEQRAYQYTMIDNPYLGFFILYKTPLKDVKNKAISLLGNLDFLLEDMKDTDFYEKFHKKWEFYRERAQFVVDYQGPPDSTPPNWSVLIGAPFWKYPPPEQKPKTTAMWPLVLGLGLIVALLVATQKKKAGK